MAEFFATHPYWMAVPYKVSFMGVFLYSSMALFALVLYNVAPSPSAQDGAGRMFWDMMTWSMACGWLFWISAGSFMVWHYKHFGYL